MRKPTVTCALLAAMGAKHRWGMPIGRDQLLAISAIEQRQYPAARDCFDALRREPFVVNRGKRGIELDSGAFGALADRLYYDCGWRPFEIKSRLKHYEGWANHDWG